MKKNIFSIIFLTGILYAVSGAFAAGDQEPYISEQAETSSEEQAFTQPTDGTEANEGPVSGDKMDQVLAAQKKILSELAEIKSELQIVKIRASQR